MRYCTNCGQPVPEEARFCVRCGAPAQDIGQSPDRLRQPASGKARRKPWRGVLGVGLALLLFYLVLLLPLPKSDAPEPIVGTWVAIGVEADGVSHAVSDYFTGSAPTLEIQQGSRFRIRDGGRVVATFNDRAGVGRWGPDFHGIEIRSGGDRWNAEMTDSAELELYVGELTIVFTREDLATF